MYVYGSPRCGWFLSPSHRPHTHTTSNQSHPSLGCDTATMLRHSVIAIAARPAQHCLWAAAAAASAHRTVSTFHDDDSFASLTVLEKCQRMAEASQEFGVSPSHDSYVMGQEPPQSHWEMSHDPDAVVRHTKAWVNAMATFPLWPYLFQRTPLENFRYHVSQARTQVEANHEIWREAAKLTTNRANGPATALLIFPQFTSDVRRFIAFGESMLQSVLRVPELTLQPLLFHPLIQVHSPFSAPETRHWPASLKYWRRSPYPMLNLHMTDELLRSAPDIAMLEEHTNKLEEIGADKLQAMLDAKDWSALHQLDCKQS